MRIQPVDGLVRGVWAGVRQDEDQRRPHGKDPADVRGERIAELHGQGARIWPSAMSPTTPVDHACAGGHGFGDRPAVEMR